MASPCSVCFFLLLGSPLSVMAWCYHSIWKCWKCMAVPICHFNSISLSFCLFICLWPLWDWLFYTRQTTYRQTTYRQTDRQTDRLTDWKTDWKTDCSQSDTDGQKGRQPTDWHRQTDQQTVWKRQKDVQAPRDFSCSYITYMYCTVSDAGVFALYRLWTRGSPYLLLQWSFTRGVAEV